MGNQNRAAPNPQLNKCRMWQVENNDNLKEFPSQNEIEIAENKKIINSV